MTAASPVRVTRGKHGQPYYYDEVIFHGPSQLLNGNGEPVMPCGATIAMATPVFPARPVRPMRWT